MGILSVFKRNSTTTDLTNPKAWLLQALGAGTNSGQTVTEETSLKFTGVLAAVGLRSSLLASMPIMVYKRIADGRQELPEDPVFRLLAYQPNPYMNAFTFWELINTHLDLWGNAYAIITRKNGVPFAISPVHPSLVEPKVDGGLNYAILKPDEFGLKPSYKPQDILHFKGISTDGIKGKSPIMLAKESIGLGLAAEKFGATFFNNNGHSRGIIEAPRQVGDTVKKALKENWEKNKDHGTPLLEDGMTYKPLSIPPEDAQFIGTRQFQIQDIARIYQVPPHLLGELSRSTFSNVEHSDIQFVKYGLRPMVKRYEKELELKLFPADLYVKSIKFNLDGILRGDTASRVAYYSSGIQNRWLSPNEARAMENMNPREGGDIYENPNTTSNGNSQASS